MPPSPRLPDVRDPRSAPSLWRDHDFVRLWVGQTASQLGAQASQLTLPLVAVVALGAGASQLGALRAVQQVPVLLLSLVVGVWVDRWRVRTLMVLADAGRALVLAVVPVAYLLGTLDLSVLAVVAFVVGVFTVCFDVAYQSSLVRLVDRGQLAQGASLLESSKSAAQIGGPALGGGLVSVFSAPLAILSGAFFFALSFLSLSRIRRSESVPHHVGHSTGMWKEIREGLRLVVGDPSLRTVGIVAGIFQFFFAAFTTIYLVFLPRTLHLSGAAVGLALAALGPGAVVGSLLSPWLTRRFGYGVVLVSAAAIADGVMLGVPALRGSGAGTLVLLMVINALFGVFGQVVDVAVMVVRQALTPVRMQGRVAATINVATMGLTPLGSLIGGSLAAQVGARTSLLLAAAGLSLSPLCMVLSPLVRLGKVLPAPAEGGPKSPSAPG